MENLVKEKDYKSHEVLAILIHYFINHDNEVAAKRFLGTHLKSSYLDFRKNLFAANLSAGYETAMGYNMIHNLFKARRIVDEMQIGETNGNTRKQAFEATRSLIRSNGIGCNSSWRESRVLPSKARENLNNHIESAKVNEEFVSKVTKAIYYVATQTPQLHPIDIVNKFNIAANAHDYLNDSALFYSKLKTELETLNKDKKNENKINADKMIVNFYYHLYRNEFDIEINHVQQNLNIAYPTANFIQSQASNNNNNNNN